MLYTQQATEATNRPKPIEVTNWWQWDFLTYELGGHQEFIHAPGVFIFSKFIGYRYYPLYIGESEDLGETLGQLTYELPGIFTYAEYVHLMSTSDEASKRKEIVKSLIERLNPAFNQQHRMGPAKWEIARIVPDWWERKMIKVG